MHEGILKDIFVMDVGRVYVVLCRVHRDSVRVRRVRNVALSLFFCCEVSFNDLVPIDKAMER